MLKQFSKLFLLLLALSVTASTHAQQITEGVIKYKVTKVKSDNPQVAQMMENSKLTMSFAGTKSKIGMAFMGGMMQMDILMDGGNSSTTLMNMMGKKYQITGMADDQGLVDNPDDVKIETFKKETKEIAGYNCYKVILTDKNGSKIQMYVTDKLALNKANKAYFDKLFPKIQGFPLEYSVNQQGMEITYTAQSVKDNVAAGAFDIPPGYTKMTQEEFQKQMGGMGGGFGF